MLGRNPWPYSSSTLTPGTRRNISSAFLGLARWISSRVTTLTVPAISFTSSWSGSFRSCTSFTTTSGILTGLGFGDSAGTADSPCRRVRRARLLNWNDGSPPSRSAPAQYVLPHTSPITQKHTNPVPNDTDAYPHDCSFSFVIATDRDTAHTQQSPRPCEWSWALDGYRSFGLYEIIPSRNGYGATITGGTPSTSSNAIFTTRRQRLHLISIACSPHRATSCPHRQRT